MQVNGMERDQAHKMNACHRHTCYPEEDDVVAGFHDRSWIVALQVGSHIRPAKRAERPQPRTEPGIEHILVLMQIRAFTMRTDRHIFTADRHFTAIVAVPDRDAMPPPELTRNAPVMDVFQPIHVDLIEA